MSSNPSYEQSKQIAEAGRESFKLPSFGRELYLGNFRLDLIHPQPKSDPDMVERGEAFIEKLTEFLRTEVDVAAIERDAKIPEQVLKGLQEIGAYGMKIPQQYGGLGLNHHYYCKALGITGTASSAITILLSAHQSIGLPEPLRNWGTEEQRQEWLPKLAKDHLSAFLLTEPDVGSDPARMSSLAVPTEDGKGYLINGTKLWATNATIADVVVIMCLVPRSEGHRGGITAFIVPREQEGITVLNRNEFLGVRGIENALIKFENVFVPNEAVVGKEGAGLRIALATLNTGRLTVPAMCTSATAYALQIAREFSIDRKQWGQSIGKHDAVAQKLAFIAGTTFGMQAMFDVCTRLADDKRNDIRIEAAIAKLWATELSWKAIDDMIQIRGGRGYETADSLARRGEKPIPGEQLLRDIRINRIIEGSSEIMRLLIAREAVDQHLSVAGDILTAKSNGDKAKAAAKASTFYAKWFPSLATGKGQQPSAFAEFGPMAKHLRYIERNSRKLARATFYLMGRYQARLEQKGHLLGRVVDIGAELFSMSCTVVYADRIANENPGQRDAIMEIADLACKQARRRTEQLFSELFNNDDDAQYKSAGKLLQGRYLFMEKDVYDPVADWVAPGTAAAPVGG